MKLAIRLLIALFALSPLVASGASGPQVILATPGVGDGAIERFTARFSEPMVALGDPRAASPFEVSCPVNGQGRWVDQQTFVYEFATPLPGGVTCQFNLRDGLKSQSGYAVIGTRNFTVDSGGPIARAVLPSAYGGEIEEDQVFLVAANLPATRESVAANAYCAVDGVAERIPVDVLDADLPGKLLSQMGKNWNARSFLSNAGLPEDLPANAQDLGKALAAVVAVRCHRPLPPGRDMALVWGAGVKSASGRDAGSDQRFDYTVRKPFTARFECSRVNPQAGCNPVQEAWVRFTAPIPRAQAEAIRIDGPNGVSLKPSFSDDDKRAATISDVKFAAPLPADSTAKLVLPAGIKDESGRPLANAERFPLDIRVDEAPPLVKFAANFGIIEAQEGGILPVTVRNVEPQLQGNVAGVGGQSLRVVGADGVIANWLRRVDDANESKYDEVKRGDETVQINQTGAKPLLTGGVGKPFQVGLPGKGKDFEVVPISLGKPGFYVVELASPQLGAALLGRKAPRYVSTAVLVTNMAVHFKWGREGSLAWVTALDTGKPVAGAEVRVSDSCNGHQFVVGKTDSDGRASFVGGLPEPQSYGDCDSDDSHPLIVSARLGDDFSFSLTSWDDGIKPSDFDLPYGWSATDHVMHTVFDRALVKQGETIHMKHYVRKPVLSGFARLPAMTGTLILSHQGSDTQFELPLTIDANGSGETAWTVPAGAPMGDYAMQFKTDKDSWYLDQTFRVDEYRLPTMKATVTGPADPQVRPRTLPLDLFVGYLSGGGASNLPVEMRVGYFYGSHSPKGYDGYSFGGRTLSEGVKPLDEDGEDEDKPLPPTQTLPLTLGADGTARTSIDVPAGLDQPTDMLVEMDYQDANGETLTARRMIPLLNSGVQIGLKTDGWLMKQDDLRLKLVALDAKGKPIAGKKVQVAVYSRETLTARRRLIGGFYAYDNQMKTTRLATTCTATTDSLGLAECKLDPGVSGEVWAVATAQDDTGNTAVSSTSVWLAGDDDWWFGGDNGDRMDVIPEQQEYKAGDKARFQVRMPYRDATALVTVEREGVISSFVTHLSGTDPVVEVPMPGAYAPEVYVSVMAVRGRVSGWWLWLSNLAREWHLPFFSQEAAKPTATVDLAKPSYRLGIAKVKVGWEGYRMQVGVKADRDRYAVRDQADVAIEVKGPDGKPAPGADVTFVAVDEALLSLAPNDSWKLLDAMMGDRDLSVITSTAQMQVVGKRHYGRKAVEAGGGGGGGDLSGLNRDNFQPVLLWQGHVALDASGRAHVKVPLSDSLSSFKLVAIAADGNGQAFGTGETEVRTAQDLTIYAGVPPLVRTGDYYAATFTLRNGSAKPMTVAADVALSPKIATGHQLKVTIPAGGAVPVAWNLTAPSQPGTLRWTVTARSDDGKAVDRVSVSQEVVRAVPIETWAGALTQVGTGSPVTIAPPAGALPGVGGVSILLSDTLAPPLQGVRDYMADYPFGCFEQRLSKAIVAGDAGAWNRLAGEIPVYLDSNGLLRYFPSDRLNGSEALTAYVLSITAEAGLTIPEDQRQKMLAAMKAVLDGKLRNEDYGDPRLQKVAAFAALARQGAATPAMLGQLGMAAKDMSTATLADYIAALAHIQAGNGAQLRAQAEGVLRQRLVYEGTRIDLSDKGSSPWWLMSSDDEATIKALLSVLGRPGWGDEGPKMMVGVASRQQRGHWDTTTANAWGVVAAQRFNSLYPAAKVAGITTASLGSVSVSRSWPLPAAPAPLKLPLPAAATPLSLTQSGGAGPWATVQVRAAVPLTQPLFAGYKLKREVTVVQARTKGVLTRGDVLKITLTIEATAERSWVVLSDPLPAGATVLGGMDNQSQLLADQADDGSGAWPSYIERGNDYWRAYYRWLPRGTHTVSYVVRLNGAGRLQLPPSRVEAMYSPEIRAQVPNGMVTVQQR